MKKNKCKDQRLHTHGNSTHCCGCYCRRTSEAWIVRMTKVKKRVVGAQELVFVLFSASSRCRKRGWLSRQRIRNIEIEAFRQTTELKLNTSRQQHNSD